MTTELEVAKSALAEAGKAFGIGAPLVVGALVAEPMILMCIAGGGLVLAGALLGLGIVHVFSPKPPLSSVSA